MRTLAIVAVLLAALPAAAKPWQGIEPGVSKREDVIQKFGEPSRVVTSDGKEIIAYFGKEAIKGTTQAQFKVDPATSSSSASTSSPGPSSTRRPSRTATAPPAPSGPPPATPCYLKKMTDEFRTYFLYPKLGLAIFFNEDGKTVHSFIFTTLKAAK